MGARCVCNITFHLLCQSVMDTYLRSIAVKSVRQRTCQKKGTTAYDKKTNAYKSGIITVFRVTQINSKR